MIYTVTFNPAIDYIIKVDNLLPGAVNRTSYESMNYGGKGINVSLILNRLGIDNIAYGFIAGFTGKEIERGLNEIGIKTDFISLEKGISRINVKITASNETEINGQGPDIPQKSIDELFRKADCIKDGDTLVLAGSIPKTLPEDIYERIMEYLQDRNINFVVDATNKLLVNVLKYRPFLIKPNNFELGEIFGKVLKNDDEIAFYAKQLQKQGARNVLVSMGRNGAMLITEKGEKYRIGVIDGEVKSTVGSGDSMVAGFIAGFIEKNDYKYALELGTAAGTATAFSEHLGNYEKIMENLKKIQCIKEE